MARSGERHGGPPRDGRRHPAQGLLPPRRGRGRRRPQRRGPVRRVRVALRAGATAGRRARPGCGSSRRPPREHGWSADGHSVVEVVVDDMPFLVDSLTMELSRQLRDVHVRHPPALRRHPRHHRRAPGGAAGRRRRRDRRRRRPRRRGPRVVDARRDRPDRRGRGHRRDRGRRSSGCCATSASPSRTGTRCTPRSPTSSHELGDRPARGRRPGRGPPGARPAAVAGRRPLHVPRLPRVRARSGDGDDEYLRARARHRARHPARRPGHVAPRPAGCPTRPPRRPARRPCWC